jgi:nucleotidyltransferase AbiEii toxin of type IV toxin-antitoxin system
MGIQPLHRDIARIILTAVTGRRAALGGGNALLVHEVTSRGTMDVDVFFGRLEDVARYAPVIEAALGAAGYGVASCPDDGDLAAIWPEAGEGIAEWEVTTPDGAHVTQVQAAYFELLAEPVTVPGIGPVVAMEDAAGYKTHALASRMLARDFADVAELIAAGYAPGELIRLARQRDPGLEPADFADAGRHLDRLPDGRLAQILPPGRDVPWLRAQFAAWPREAPPRRG